MAGYRVCRGVPFFVLSGFLLMLPWTKHYYEGGRAPSLKEYYMRRVMRIVPAYYAHLAVFFLIMVPVVHSFSMLLSPLGLMSVLAHLTFTQYLFPSTSAGFGINGALWTLTIEAMFYLTLPSIAHYFLGRRALLGLLAALAVAQGWLYLSFHQLFEFAAWVLPNVNVFKYDPLVIKLFLALQFPAQIFYFTMGMALTNLLFLCHKKHFGMGFAASFLTLLGLAGLFWVMWLIARVNIWNTGWLYGWHAIVAVILGGLVLSAAMPSLVSRKLLGARPVRIIGLISYSIYLWHLPVIFFMKTYFTPAGLEGVQLFQFMLISCLTLTLLIAYFSYVYVELPFLRRREKVVG